MPRDIMGRSPTWNVGQYSAKFGGHRHCGSGDVMVLFVMWPLRSPDQRVIWLYGWEPLIASHHSTRFNGHRHWGIRDIILLVVEQQDCTCLLTSAIVIFSKAHQINQTFSTQRFSIVSNEFSPVLVTRALGNQARSQEERGRIPPCPTQIS